MTRGVKKQSKSLVLQLNLKRKYFAQIVEGTKRIEYREAKPYWKARLEDKEFDVIHFRNGYAKDAPEMDVQCRGVRLVGKGRDAQYQIKLGRILKKKRWR